MRLTVRMHGMLTRLLDGRDALTVELAAGSSMKDLLAHLGIDRRELWFQVVNGQMADPDTILREGDAIDLVPPIGGGMDSRRVRGEGQRQAP